MWLTICLLYPSDPAKANYHYQVGATKYIKQILTKPKEKTDSNTKIVGTSIPHFK